MERTISYSNKQNKVIQILLRSLLGGMVGYFIFIFSLIGSFYLLSHLFKIGSSELGDSILILSSAGYLILYTVLLIKQMRINNYCK